MSFLNDTTSLGFFCQSKDDYCSATTLRQLGQSCASNQQCLQGCCEDTVCQTSKVCFTKYILPFAIVFGVLAVFVVSAAIILVVHKYRKRIRDRKELEAYRKEQEAGPTFT